MDTDLVDAVATGEPARQVAIAGREALPASVSAAIAEVGCAESCLVLLENDDSEIAPFSLDRIVERYGHLAVIRDLLLARDDISATTRQALVAKLSQTLADFVASRQWLPQDRAQRIAKEACDKATITLAAESPNDEVRPLVRHLRASKQLTAGLILRSLFSGNLTMVEESLADLSGMPVARVVGIMHDRRGVGLRALYDRAGLPASTFLVFREALEAMREDGFAYEAVGATQLKRRIIERVLTRCEAEELGDIEPLLTMLRRFAAEAAREEARMFCEDLVACDDRGYIEVDRRDAA